MSPGNLGETTHRHLSPLVGLFPGDRIRPDGSTPADLVDGATALLTARGMESFGWANAWRSLCWARLKSAENACQPVVNNLRPSTGGGNGTAPNLFDRYEVSLGRGIWAARACTAASSRRSAANSASGNRSWQRARSYGAAGRPGHGSAAWAAGPRRWRTAIKSGP
jgi:hypothetical protein